MPPGFNYREGLILQDVSYQGRSLLKRASLVEMSVPYGDPFYPWQRKDAIDVGTYGIGFCANSLELGCDCLGHIHYFDVYISNSMGEPTKIKQAICMHEEDNGILWKHVEYRNGMDTMNHAEQESWSFPVWQLSSTMTTCFIGDSGWTGRLTLKLNSRENFPLCQHPREKTPTIPLMEYW